MPARLLVQTSLRHVAACVEDCQPGKQPKMAVTPESTRLVVFWKPSKTGSLVASKLKL